MCYMLQRRVFRIHKRSLFAKKQSRLRGEKVNYLWNFPYLDKLCYALPGKNPFFLQLTAIPQLDTHTYFSLNQTRQTKCLDKEIFYKNVQICLYHCPWVCYDVTEISFRGFLVLERVYGGIWSATGSEFTVFNLHSQMGIKMNLGLE